MQRKYVLLVLLGVLALLNLLAAQTFQLYLNRVLLECVLVLELVKRLP